MGLNSRLILRSFSHCLGNAAYKRKLKSKPDCFFTLREFCERAELDVDSFDEEIKRLLNATVSYVCRWGDRFTKNCICVQLYDDSDEIMRKAFAAGALVCVSNHKIAGVPCVVAKNPTKVYADMCGLIRDTSSISSTAIVGSIGKTTAKKMVEAVYKKAFNTMCDSGNDNILDSIGSICQHIPNSAQQLVLEMSEDTPGIIEEMAKIAKPEIAIITAVDKSHIEFYGSEEEIFKEFSSITKYMDESATCIVSLDQENLEKLVLNKRLVTVSQKNPDADFHAKDITTTESGLSFTVCEKATAKCYKVKLFNTFALHNITSALFAFAAGALRGISREKIVEGLGDYRSLGIRQNIYKSGSTTIYADCYNAVAKSVRSAVLASCKIPITGKRIAVLGDVSEAGVFTKSTHSEILDIVNNSNFDILATCGEELKTALKEKNLRNNISVLTFNSQLDMNRALKKIIKPGDLVLFKASHSGRLQKSISYCFPIAFLKQSIKYYTPRIKWHFKIILN